MSDIKQSCHSGGSKETVQCPLQYGRTFLLENRLDYKNIKLPKG